MKLIPLLHLDGSQPKFFIGPKRGLVIITRDEKEPPTSQERLVYFLAPNFQALTVGAFSNN
jgi:hypothetical protein